MKKYLFIMAGTLLSVLAFSQDRSVDVRSNALSGQYSGLARDTVTTVDTAYIFQLNIDQAIGAKVLYQFKVKLKEVSAAAGTNIVALQGKKFADDSWTVISAVKYWGTGTDTSIYIVQETTAVAYNYLSVRIGQKTGVSKVYPEYIKYYIKK
jgi:hypothetical protein